MGAISETLRQDLRQPEFSEGYAESFQDAYVATQIKVLREQNHWTQAALAKELGTTQTVISRIENVNYSAWNISTLKKLARAFRVRLKVSFETYGSLIHDVDSFSREGLQRLPRESDPELLDIEKPIAKTVSASDSYYHSLTGLLGPPSDEAMRYVESAARAMAERVMAYSAGGMLQGLTGGGTNAGGGGVDEQEIGLSSDLPETEIRGAGGVASVPRGLAPVIPIDRDFAVKHKRRLKRNDRGGRGAHYGRTRKHAVGI